MSTPFIQKILPFYLYKVLQEVYTAFAISFRFYFEGFMENENSGCMIITQI